MTKSRGPRTEPWGTPQDEINSKESLYHILHGKNANFKLIATHLTASSSELRIAVVSRRLLMWCVNIVKHCLSLMSFCPFQCLLYFPFISTWCAFVGAYWTFNLFTTSLYAR